MNSELFKKNQLKLYQVLFISITIIFIYVFFTKVLGEYFYFFELLSEYNNAVEQLESESGWKEKSINLRREIHRTSNKIGEINLNIPSAREISNPINLLDSLLVKNKVNLQKLQIVAIDTTKQYQFVKLKLITKSSFNKLKHFINEVENSSIIFTIKSYKMKLASLYRRNLETEIYINVLLRR